jgi:hypothetical protein
VIQLVRSENGEIVTEGRFTMAAVDNAAYTILLVRVNNNHYHVGQESPALATSTCITTQTRRTDGKISASIRHTLLSPTSSSSTQTETPSTSTTSNHPQ